MEANIPKGSFNANGIRNLFKEVIRTVIEVHVEMLDVRSAIVGYCLMAIFLLTASVTLSESETCSSNHGVDGCSPHHGSASAPAASGDEKQIDLFLLGKTGHGKSTAGNSILGREAFEVSDSSQSETYVVQVGWARRQGRIVKVVDGPGLAETRLGKGEAAKKMVNDMSQGISQCPDGFHALLLVLKYPNRFTEEEMSTIYRLKSMFGTDFVKNHCILLFTHGILYDLNNKRKQKPFSDWLREQTGPLKTLLEEVNYRAVLFYKDDETKEEAQLKELFALVDGLSTHGKRYTNDMFAKVSEEREKLIVMDNAPQLREAIQAKIDDLQDAVNKVKDATRLDDVTRNKIVTAKQDARNLELEIHVQDKGTGVLDSLKRDVVNIVTSVGNHEKALVEKQIKEERESQERSSRPKPKEILKKIGKKIEKALKKIF